MSYIPHIAFTHEKLLGIYRPSRLYIVIGLFWLLLISGSGICLGFALYPDVQITGLGDLNIWSIYFRVHFTITVILSVLAGLVAFWFSFITFASTEVGLTDQRILFKTGLFLVQIEQIELEDIKGEHIKYGAFGKFFNYGRLKLECDSAEDIYFPVISKPDGFIQALHSARKAKTER